MSLLHSSNRVENSDDKSYLDVSQKAVEMIGKASSDPRDADDDDWAAIVAVRSVQGASSPLKKSRGKPPWESCALYKVASTKYQCCRKGVIRG